MKNGSLCIKKEKERKRKQIHIIRIIRIIPIIPKSPYEVIEMPTRKMWKCDFEDCEEFAQWYRRKKGKIVKLCTKHEVQLAKEHWGRRVDFSELTHNDIRYFNKKESETESANKIPFEIQLIHLEDGTLRVAVKDRRTNKWRSFTVKKWTEEINEINQDLQKGKFSMKSLDDFVKMLKEVSL